MTIRYVAFHKTQPGYETAEQVEDWISIQDNPEDYFVVATTSNFEPTAEAEKLRLDNIQRKIQQRVDTALECQKQIIINNLFTYRKA